MKLQSWHALLLATRVLGQTSTLPFNPAVASAYACPAACQTILAEGIEADEATFNPSAVRDQSFFATASNFTSNSKPGDILKLEKVQNLASYDPTSTLPAGVTLYAIQYVSVGFNNTKVPVTGFVAFPFLYADSLDAETSSKKFPLISFAHGTSGFSPGCSPTKSYNFYDYFTWTPLILSGFAVVGTDYAGLGNNYTRHPYLATTINSNDVLYAAQAAKAAFPDKLTSQWASVGHSQGGGAAYALTENKLAQNSGFLGSVAISPAARVFNLVVDAAAGAGADASSMTMSPNSSSSSSIGYVTLFNWALEVAFPSANATQYLSHTFGLRTQLAAKLKLCLDGAGSLAEGLSISTIFSKNGEGSWLTLLQKFQNETGSGTGRKSYAPLLIVQSSKDQTVPYQATLQAYNASCQAGNQVQMALLPLMDHSPTPSATSGLWISWLKDRFAGKAAVKGCKLNDLATVDSAAAYAPLDSQGY